MTSGPSRDGVRLVDHLQRSDANRATRSVHKLDLVRQQMVDAVFDDGVRLSAADFHQDPRPRRDAPDFIDNLLRQRFVTIFVEEFHASCLAAGRVGHGITLSGLSSS